MKFRFKQFLVHASISFRVFLSVLSSLWADIIAPFGSRKEKWRLPLLLVCLCGLFTSVLSFGVFLPNTKSEALAELATSFSEQTPSVFGAIYQKDLFPETSGGVIANADPEKAVEMRSIYSSDGNNVFFDFYQSNWMGRYSPGVVDYENEEKINVSVLLWPQKTQFYAKYLYDFFSFKALSLPAHDITPTDICINDKMGRKLLNGGTEYASLLGTTVRIPCVFGSNSVGIVYKIIGVLDSESTEYKNFAELFGDFFLGNEYLNLPIPKQTYFQIQNSLQENRKRIESILKLYKNESRVQYLSSYQTRSLIEYRISFFSSLSAEYALTKISIEPSPVNQETDKIFDTFVNSSTIIPLLCFGLANLLMLTLSLLLARDFSRDYWTAEKKIQSTLGPSLFMAFCLALTMTVAIPIEKILIAYFPVFSGLPYANFWSLIIELTEALFLLLAFVVPLRRITDK